MKDLSRRALIAVLASAPAMGCAARETAAKTAAADRLCTELLERHHTPGMSIAVIDGGATVLAKGYGLADLEWNVAAAADTVYQTGSVGKMFLATLALLMAREGALDFDAPLKTWLPGAPRSWDRLTMRHLLQHTSGLGDYDPWFDPRLDYSEDQLVEELYRHPLKSPAGAAWDYSNTGYLLAGIVIGKADNRHYGDLMRERIFSPLGMGDSRLISDRDIIARRAAGYEWSDERLRNQDWVSPTFNSTGDGALYTTALDMAKWAQAVRTNSLLTAEELAVMTTPSPQSVERARPYGMGMNISGTASRRLHWHGGAWQGFVCTFLRSVDDDLFVVVHANCAEFPVEQAAEQFARIWSPGLPALPIE